MLNEYRPLLGVAVGHSQPGQGKGQKNVQQNSLYFPPNAPAASFENKLMPVSIISELIACDRKQLLLPTYTAFFIIVHCNFVRP